MTIPNAIFMVVFLLSGFPVFAEAPICGISRVTSGPVSGRAGTVAFPDGRKFTVVGHAHGVTKSILDLQMLVNDVESSNDRFLNELKRRLQVVSETVEHFKADRQYLLSRLEANDVQFVALEAGEAMLKTTNERTGIMWGGGKENLDRRKLNQNAILHETILAYGGAGRYVKIMHPEYREAYKLVGVENDNLMQESLDSVDEAADQLNILYDRLPRNHPFRETLFGLLASGRYHEMLGYPEGHIIAELRQMAPPEVRVQIPGFVRALLKKARLLRERDRQTTPKLLANKGSTIYFVGFAHLDSQLQLLEEACRRQLFSPVAPASASTTR